MKNYKKIISLITGALMLMQISSFASEKELTWSCLLDNCNISMPTFSNEYSDELGFVFQDGNTGKKGTIDKNGNILIPAEHDSIDYYYSNKYVQVERFNKEEGKSEWAILNSKGESIIDYGIYSLMEKVDDSSLIAKKGDVYGVISPEGKVLVDFIYSSLEQTDQNKTEGINFVCGKKGDKYGVIDTAGKEIISFEHAGRIVSYMDGKYFKVDINYGSGYLMDANGNTIIDGDIRSIGYDNGRISVLYNDQTPLTYINEKGEISSDSSFGMRDGYYVNYLTEEYDTVSKEGKKGIADKNMNIILPVKYNSVEHVSGEIFAVKENDLSEKVYIDVYGNPVDYMNRYDSPMLLKSGYISGVDKEYGNHGMADKEGNIIIPFEYAGISEITNGLYIIKTHTGKTGIAEFGTGKKIKDTFEGLVLTINSTTAKAFNEEVVMDVAPIIINGRTMLPARFVAENLGATVAWDQETQTVTISKDVYDLYLTIGSYEYKIGPYVNQLDSPAFIENGRTYTPVRTVAGYLGADIFWDQETQTVKILSK